MSPRRRKIVVVGTTAWGTTLGIMLGRQGSDVLLCARTEQEAILLNRERQNSARLPGYSFPERLSATADLEKALDKAAMAVLAVPAQTMRRNAQEVRRHLGKGTVILSVAKGIETGSARTMSRVLCEELPPELHSNVCVLSGPNLSDEVARGLPATAVAASVDITVAQKVQQMMSSPVFRVYSNTDVVGVELGGALKNIIALAAGMVDGLDYGNNTKAGLITRGLVEITRLGVAAGANPLTFSGLAGMGDLVATCSSPLSRNRFVGQELAKGRKLDEIKAGMIGVSEGVTTTPAALKLAAKLNVEMPITEQVNRVLFEGLDVRQAVTELMCREPKHEFAGIPRPVVP